MICVHCGTLNAAGNERCTNCGRPPAAATAEMCAEHPDRAAVSTCAICDKPLCDACVIRVAGNAYCHEHAEDLTTATGPDGVYSRPVVSMANAVPATFLQRVGAGLLDLCLIAVYVLVVFLVLWALTGSPPTNRADAGGWTVVFWLLVVLGALGYLCWENADNGQTLGKAGTDLIALREDGTLMDTQTGVMRGILSALGFLLGGIGFWYMLWSPDHRALHDRILGTVVVKTSAE